VSVAGVLGIPDPPIRSARGLGRGPESSHCVVQPGKKDVWTPSTRPGPERPNATDQEVDPLTGRITSGLTRRIDGPRDERGPGAPCPGRLGCAQVEEGPAEHFTPPRTRPCRPSRWGCHVVERGRDSHVHSHSVGVLQAGHRRGGSRVRCRTPGRARRSARPGAHVKAVRSPTTRRWGP